MNLVLWLKGLAIGFATGIVVMGTASLLANREGPADARGVEGPPPAFPTEPTLATAVQGAATEVNPPPPPPPPPDPLPSLDPLPSRDAMPTPPTRPSLAEELAAINAVRAALVAKDARAAMAGLDQYELKYPTGSFGLRAQLLRIEALAVSGRPHAAKELASAFLAAHPDSPYAPRLRAFVSNETSFQ